MPVVFRHKGARYGFYSNEGDPREPPHVHAWENRADAKFWLVPTVDLAYNRGHSAERFANWPRSSRIEGGHSWRLGMDSFPKAKEVRFDAETMWVTLTDGRVLGVPVSWFPRLGEGSAAQRERVQISNGGLHWDELDEDISIGGLLAGRGDQTHRRRPDRVA